MSLFRPGDVPRLSGRHRRSPAATITSTDIRFISSPMFCAIIVIIATCRTRTVTTTAITTTTTITTFTPPVTTMVTTTLQLPFFLSTGFRIPFVVPGDRQTGATDTHSHPCYTPRFPRSHSFTASQTRSCSIFSLLWYIDVTKHHHHHKQAIRSSGCRLRWGVFFFVFARCRITTNKTEPATTAITKLQGQRRRDGRRGSNGTTSTPHSHLDTNDNDKQKCVQNESSNRSRGI